MATILAQIKLEDIRCQGLTARLYRRFELPDYVHLFPGLEVHDHPHASFTIGERLGWNNILKRYEAFTIVDEIDVRIKTKALMSQGWNLESTTFSLDEEEPVEKLLKTIENNLVDKDTE